jgi:hypothetical protein
LARVAVLLLVHAVAVSALHRHEIAGPTASAEEHILPLGDTTGTAFHDTSANCPACQLQQGYAAEVTAPASLCSLDRAPLPRSEAARQIILRAADGSPPGRAPPVL